MARLNDNGTIDYEMPDFQAPAAPKSQAGQKIDPSTGLPINDNDPSFGGTSTAPPPTFTNTSGVPSSFTPSQTPTGTLTPQNYQQQSVLGSPGYIDNFISDYGSRQGVNPSVTNDPTYWKNAIAANGGIKNQSDVDYWAGRFMQAEGAPAGQGAGGGGATAPAGVMNGTGSDLTGLLTSLIQGQQTNQTATTAQRQSVLNRLFALADQYGAPVSADDPNIKAGTDAYTGQVNRSVNDFKKQSAERAYAEGVPTGAFDSQVGNATLQGGRAIGDYQTQLMHDELLSRRQSLTDVLGQSGSLLSAQDSADLNSRIASIDAALKSKGIDVTQQLGVGGLNLQDKLGSGALANQTTAVNNQNNQFYDQLGQNGALGTGNLTDILASLLLSGS